MQTILILVEDEAMADNLHRQLPDEYEVIEQQREADFDLAILDEQHLNVDWIAEKKMVAFPRILPFLLIANPASLQNGLDEGCCDDLLLTPAQPAEIQSRVKAMLDLRRMSLMLSEQQEKLISIGKALDSTSDAILIADITGASVFHNEAFVQLYGYSEKALNRGGIANVLFSSAPIAQQVFETIEQGNTWSGEALLKTDSGQSVLTRLRADRIEDHSGNLLGMISVFTDITEVKHAEAREHEQRVLSNALRDIATALNSTLDLNEVLKRILSSLGRVVAHDAANVMLIEGDVARIVGHHGYRQRGFDTAHLAALRVSVDDTSELKQMVEEKKPFIVWDVWEADWQSPLRADWLRSHIGIPIVSQSSVIGFLNLDSDAPGFFTETHLESLLSFAEHAAIAIQNARLHQQAEELGAMKERQRIARDLHDAVSQTLFSATVIAEAVVRLWQTNPQKVLSRLEQLHQLTRGALAEMRTLLLELRPDALLEAETSDVFEQLIEGIRGRTRLEIELDVTLAEPLPSEAHVALYYITQEALNNIVKHAGAKRVTVRLVREAGRVTLKIADDGDGFELAKVAPTSMGLQIMHERAATIGADIDIRTRDGEGTAIEVIWKEHGNE